MAKPKTRPKRASKPARRLTGQQRRQELFAMQKTRRQREPTLAAAADARNARRARPLHETTETPELGAARSLHAELNMIVRELENPHTAEERRRTLGERVLALQLHAMHRKPTPREKAVILRGYLFSLIEMNARSLACVRHEPDDRGPEERGAFPLRDLAARDVARDLMAQFARQFPGERIDAEPLATVIDEWIIDGAPSDPAKRGGRRRGRTGKWNALRRAVAGTTFGATARTLENAYRSWSARKKAPTRSRL